MSSYQIKIAKYYRLSDKSSVETENVAVLVDTKNRRLSVSCRRIQKENVPISLEPGAFPKITFRDNHLYVLFSGSSADGFRLTFGAKEREGFVKLMHSMGVLTDVPTEFQGENSSESSQFSMSQESQGMSGAGSVKMESQGNPHHRQPAFTQQPTPQVSLFPPNVRRDTTDVFNPQHQNPHSFSQPPPSDSPSFRHHPYYGIAYETTGGRSSMTSSSSSRHQNQSPMSFSQKISSGSTVSAHEYGESVKTRRDFRVIEEKQNSDKATQTEDLIDVLIEDKDFIEKAVAEIMKNEQFVGVVQSMRSRLESMDTVERQRLHWKTNPNFNSQGMPPPVIHLPNSDAE